MEAGHLQECNKQLFEDQLRRVILEAKERVQKAKSQPGTDSTGERAVLETQISSESISAGAASSQQVCGHVKQTMCWIWAELFNNNLWLKV